MSYHLIAFFFFINIDFEKSILNNSINEKKFMDKKELFEKINKADEFLIKFNTFIKNYKPS